jgi:hypothetical protein
MWLNERAVGNDYGKLKGRDAKLFKQISNLVRNRETKFERGHFVWARIQIVSAGTTFIDTGNHMTNINLGLNECSQYRNRQFGSSQKCHTPNRPNRQRC